jgi:hypothetical protein
MKRLNALKKLNALLENVSDKVSGKALKKNYVS